MTSTAAKAPRWPKGKCPREAGPGTAAGAPPALKARRVGSAPPSRQLRLAQPAFLRRLAHERTVVTTLHGRPELGACAEVGREAHGHVARDRTSAGQNSGDLICRDVDSTR